MFANTDDKNRISVPADEPFLPFFRSFNRLTYFCCISDNLDVSVLPSNWSVRKNSAMKFGINKPQKEIRENLVGDFKNQIRMYVLRESIESFALSLDEFFFLLLLNGKYKEMNQSPVDTLSKDELKEYNIFCTKGIAYKITKIEERLKVEFSRSLKEIATSLKDIRNCFSHSNGIVRTGDGFKESANKRKFQWISIDLIVSHEDGEELNFEANKSYEKGSSLYLKSEMHSKVFEIGDTLQFDSFEVFEIGYALNDMVKEIILSAKKALTKQLDPTP